MSSSRWADAETSAVVMNVSSANGRRETLAEPGYATPDDAVKYLT